MRNVLTLFAVGLLFKAHGVTSVVGQQSVPAAVGTDWTLDQPLTGHANSRMPNRQCS
jgi:hypothetical protein